jgi:hypothetical protein
MFTFVENRSSPVIERVQFNPYLSFIFKIKIVYIKIKGVAQIKLEGVMYMRQSILIYK